MAISITKLMFRSLLAVGLLLATVDSSLSQSCPVGSNSVFHNQTCYCPYGMNHFGDKVFMADCNFACPVCTPDRPKPQRPSDDSASEAPAPQTDSRQGKLGVKFHAVDQNAAYKLGLGTTQGALVVGLFAIGPAAHAGILMGDVIVQFNGHDIVKSSDLPGAVSTATIGQEVAVVVIRNGEKLSFSLSVADFDADEAPIFEQGRRDRTKWEKWVNGLKGDARDGALFWAGERDARAAQSLPSCSAGRGQTSDEFRRACVTARLFLTAVDSRLDSETDYRDGWNRN